MRSRCSTSCDGRRTETVSNDETMPFQVVPGAFQTVPQSLQGVPGRFNSPRWWEFEAATPINQRWKGLRVTGFVLFAGGAVVVMYMSRPPTEQAEALLACVLYVLILDPFIAVGSILARASRVILASVVVLAGVAVAIPSPELIGASILWGLVAVAAVKRFNHRYLMQDTFASARAIPDAIRTAPESKAGNAWRHSGAKLANALAAELGATCRDYAEVKARELTFYIGYQMADTKMDELTRKCERLRLENTLLKDAEKEKSELLQAIDQMEAEHKKRLERANTECRQLVRRVRMLEEANAELSKAVPDEVKMDDLDAKLDHAYNVLHMSDGEAAEFAGVSKTQAWRYRKDHNIEPRGGKT